MIFIIIENKVGLPERIAVWLATQKFTSSGMLSCMTFDHIPELSFVYVDIAPHKDAQWQILQGYRGTNTSAERLQSFINKKEDKIIQYDNKLDEIWLLVVIDFMDRGMDQEPANVDYSGICVTKFDKVILYKTVYNSVFEFTKNGKHT